MLPRLIFSKTSDEYRFGMSQVLKNTLGNTPSATVSSPPVKDYILLPTTSPIPNVTSQSQHTSVLAESTKNYSKIVTDFLSEELPTISKPKRLTSKVTLINFSPEKSPNSTKTCTFQIPSKSSDTSHIDLIPSELCYKQQCITDSDFQLSDLSLDSIPFVSQKNCCRKQEMSRYSWGPFYNKS